jgi:AcrR family transcriptional regulator
LLTERSVNNMPIKKIDKESILHNCWEVLNRDGYYAASISNMAEASNLGKAGLLHHFGSKEKLMQAVLDYACEQFRNYVLSVASEALPMEQRLEKLLRRQNRMTKLDRRGCFFANTALETGRDGIFNHFIEQIFEEWKQAVGGIYASLIPEADAKAKAYRLLLEYEGAVLFYKLTDDTKHLEDFVQRAIQDFKSYQKK